MAQDRHSGLWNAHFKTRLQVGLALAKNPWHKRVATASLSRPWRFLLSLAWLQGLSQQEWQRYREMASNELTGLLQQVRAAQIWMETRASFCLFSLCPLSWVFLLCLHGSNMRKRGLVGATRSHKSHVKAPQQPSLLPTLWQLLHVYRPLNLHAWCN